MAGTNFPLLSPKETSIDEEENYPSVEMEKSPQRTLRNLFTTLLPHLKCKFPPNEIGTRYISEYIRSSKTFIGRGKGNRHSCSLNSFFGYFRKLSYAYFRTFFCLVFSCLSPKREHYENFPKWTENFSKKIN